jgi:hypothetical protein
MSAPKGNQNARGNRGGPGRTPLYSEKLIRVVRTLALHGASDEEIADAIGISRETLRWWRHEHIEFANGTRITDDEMAEAARTSLFRRAMGFTFKTEKVFQFQGEIIRGETTEYVPPDVNAAFKILQAYDKKQAFREKTETTPAFSLADLVALSMEKRARKGEQGNLIETRANRAANEE